MQKFLEFCNELGLSQTVLNGQKLRNGVQAGLSDCSLFFICGYDYIHHPNDMKFWGIEHLFVQENAPFALNLGPRFRPQFQAALTLENVRIQPPVLGGARLVQPKGVRMLGAANYNIQTNALELIVTDPNGMDYNQGLVSVMPNLKKAFAKPPSAMSAHTQEEVSEMQVAVRRYWGSDMWRLGL